MIKLATDVSFKAEEAVTQKFGYVARSGAGKTYAAGVLVEGLLKEKQQVIVLDPVGVWFGLRLDTHGKPSQFELPVFGGLHGDLPLAPSAGALIAQLICERGISAVIDVSDMRKGRQREFVTAFAEELFHLKKKTRSPVHIVFEEAHEFAPQHAQKGEERMLGAIEDLVRLGRNYGIGCSFISQRPQAVAKAVLNQVECLVALQTNGAHERKAIESWVSNTAGVTDHAVVNLLPSLAIGEAFVWSPQWLRMCVRCKINKKTTYDASSTPTAKSKTIEPKPLSGDDVDALKKAMAAVEDETAKNDPRKLRARILELEKLLGMAKKSVAGADAPKLREENASLRAAYDGSQRENGDLRGRLKSVNEIIQRAAQIVGVVDGKAPTETPPAPVPKSDYAHETIREKMAATPTRARPSTELKEWAQKNGHQIVVKSSLKKGARAMLYALAQAGKPLTRTQIATLSGLSPSSGTFSSYMSSLRTEGYVVEEHGFVKLNEDGAKAANGHAREKLTPEHVRAMWMSKLKAGARRMLQALVDNPQGMSREDLADQADIERTSGTFSSYFSTLRSNGLVEENQSTVYAVEELLG